MKLCCPNCSKGTGRVIDLQRYTNKDMWHCPECGYEVSRMELMERAWLKPADNPVGSPSR